MFQSLAIRTVSKLACAKTSVKSLANKANEHVASDKKAQGILEYGLLFVVVGLALIMGLRKLKDALSSKLEDATKTINDTK
jgi:hypothetical protein